MTIPMRILWPDMKKDLQKLLARIDKGEKGFLFGYRQNPINGIRQFHSGFDVPKPAGTPIHLPWEGFVLKAWNDDLHGGGNSIIIRTPSRDIIPHSVGICHLKEFSEEAIENATENDGIKDLSRAKTLPVGTIIGYVNSTGASTGNHAHITIRRMINRQLFFVDPLPYLLEACGIDIPYHKVG